MADAKGNAESADSSKQRDQSGGSPSVAAHMVARGSGTLVRQKKVCRMRMHSSMTVCGGRVPFPPQRRVCNRLVELIDGSLLFHFTVWLAVDETQNPS